MPKLPPLQPVKLEDIDNPPPWADGLLRSHNDLVTALQSATSGGFSLTDNLQCEIVTATFSHGAAQLVTLRKLPRATAILCSQAGGGSTSGATVNPGSQGINHALLSPPVLLGMASAAGGSNGGLPRVKVLCYFRDSSAVRVPVTLVFVNEPGMAASAMAPSLQQAWVAPTFSNSWANYGAGTYSIGYYKDCLGVVRLRGAMATGTINTAAFNLPAGYRPLSALNFAAASNSAFALLSITAAGDVVPVNGSNVWFSLDGISFLAEQ